MKRVLLGMLLFVFFAGGSALAQSSEQFVRSMFVPHKDDFDGMEKRRIVRIIVPFSKTIYFIDRGQQLGTAVEFGTALENELNKGRKKQIDKIRVGFVPMPRAKLLSALEDGLGYIVMANLTITEGWSPHPAQVLKTGDWVRVDPHRRVIELLRR